MRVLSRADSLDRLIDLSLKKRSVILYGAGLSMLNPTSLPSGLDLRDDAVRSVLSVDHLYAAWKGLKVSKAYQNMVPEAAFEQLHGVLRSDLLPYFRRLDGAESNRAHYALGQLSLKLGVPLITTNFDDLVERSCEQQVDPVHLHGSLIDLTSLVVRLGMIGRGLPQATATQMHNALEGRELWVFGYSGVDRDVMDELKYHNLPIHWLVKGRQETRTLEALRLAAIDQLDVSFGDLHVWADVILKKLGRRPNKGNPTLALPKTRT